MRDETTKIRYKVRCTKNHYSVWKEFFEYGHWCITTQLMCVCETKELAEQQALLLTLKL
jgi:hypothetical protein